MSLCPEEDDIPWDSLRDNRDLTVLVSWNPKDRYEESILLSYYMFYAFMCFNNDPKLQAAERGTQAALSRGRDPVAEVAVAHAASDWLRLCADSPSNNA